LLINNSHNKVIHKTKHSKTFYGRWKRSEERCSRRRCQR